MGRKRVIMGKCPVCREVLRTDHPGAHVEGWEAEDVKIRKVLSAHFSDEPVCALMLVEYKLSSFKN